MMVKELGGDDREVKVVDKKIDIFDLTGLDRPVEKPKYKRAEVQKAQSGHIPLMKLQEITEDEIILNRVHWELVKNSGKMYIFRRRSDHEIERMRESGEFDE